MTAASAVVGMAVVVGTAGASKESSPAEREDKEEVLLMRLGVGLRIDSWRAAAAKGSPSTGAGVGDREV